MQILGDWLHNIFNNWKIIISQNHTTKLTKLKSFGHFHDSNIYELLVTFPIFKILFEPQRVYPIFRKKQKIIRKVWKLWKFLPISCIDHSTKVTPCVQIDELHYIDLSLGNGSYTHTGCIEADLWVLMKFTPVFLW